VMAKTRSLKYRMLAGGSIAALLILASLWMVFAIPLFEFAVLVAHGLGTTLVDLGEGWLALVFLPVNNIASLMVLTARAVLIARKKIISTSFGK